MLAAEDDDVADDGDDDEDDAAATIDLLGAALLERMLEGPASLLPSLPAALEVV